MVTVKKFPQVALTATVAEPVEVQPAAFVTVTFRVIGLVVPAVNVMELVPAPEVIAPLTIVQT